MVANLQRHARSVGLRSVSLLLAAFPAAAAVQDDGAGEDSSDLDLTELSLDDLMDIEVTIASKTKQRLLETPASRPLRLEVEHLGGPAWCGQPAAS